MSACECGCGEQGPGRFRKGHNAKVRERALGDHGTRGRYRQGCRCDECRAANAEREVERRRARGLYPPVPRRPVRKLKKRPVTPESFLMDRMEPDKSGCWIWKRALNHGGYGVTIKGDKSGATVLAHRRSYEVFIGPIPDGLHVDHLCNVRACINPAHLQAVTQAENNRRMHKRMVRS